MQQATTSPAAELARLFRSQRWTEMAVLVWTLSGMHRAPAVHQR
jgi:hypothetical protein